MQKTNEMNIVYTQRGTELSLPFLFNFPSCLNFILTYLFSTKIPLIFHLFFIYLTCSIPYSYNIILTATYWCRPNNEILLKTYITESHVRLWSSSVHFISFCLPKLMHENFTPWRHTKSSDHWLWVTLMVRDPDVTK